jgi:phosphoglucosamine mutase
VLPTPTLAFAAKEFDCAVMVTASHNPPEYNGLKMLNPDGSPFDIEQQRQIEDCIESGGGETVTWDLYKSLSCTNTAVGEHIESVRKRFKLNYKIRVVADCGGGAATSITPRMLEALGCQVHVLNGTPTGYFPRPSEPIEDNLAELMRTVVETRADLGLAHDGDADRVMAVDERGRFIRGDDLLAIFAGATRARKIITTVDASMTIDDLGVPVTRTAVGDNNVSEALKAGGDFGGEPSGAWIFPESSLCPDGIYAAAMLVEIASKGKLSQLVDALKHYPIRRGSAKGSVNIDKLKPVLVAALKPVSLQQIDGLKLNLEDGWALLRPSGTEPKMRLTVEAKTETRMNEVFKTIENLMLESTR